MIHKTVTDAALFYGVTRATIYKWLKQGQIARIEEGVMGPKTIKPGNSAPKRRGDKLAEWAATVGISPRKARKMRQIGAIVRDGDTYMASPDFTGTKAMAESWLEISPGDRFGVWFEVLGTRKMVPFYSKTELRKALAQTPLREVTIYAH